MDTPIGLKTKAIQIYTDISSPDEEFSFKVVGVENIAFSSRVLDVEGGVADGFVVSA